MPDVNYNSGIRSFHLVDNYPTQLNKTISNSLYIAYSSKSQEYHQTARIQVTANTLLTMRLSIFNTTLMMMKRMLMRIWLFTRNTLFFVSAVLRFMYLALEFVVLFIKFLFTQKHWSN
ncbi:hypothetical protein RG47T_3940 [Mucilaginibacter polytrichastri]|uniref:Uncharacterized protein n=2 Tax=Mucilaginibacter polytrichastri TaxID=1302689 RepID=A0A1Q6A398_9SPHI|nr:hypothetical protein RG47T_3940 [Mucilaginibacter polytrichastri]